MSDVDIHEALSILHDTKPLVLNYCWKISSLEEPSFLEDMEKIQKAMCNIEGNFMSFIFYRNNLVEINEFLHEEYLTNKDIHNLVEINEDIHKLKIQNEKLLDRLQDTCSSSYVSNFHRVYCLEDYHDMMDHEKHGKLQVIDVFEYDLDESQSLVVVEE